MKTGVNFPFLIFKLKILGKFFIKMFRSLGTKQNELFDDVCFMDFHIICVTQTWFNDEFDIQRTVHCDIFL